MDRLHEMIGAQHALQRALNTDPYKMNDEERIQYIKDQVLALQLEIAEFMNEVGWKPWATSRHINRDAAFGELRDAWQHLTNLMLAVNGGLASDVARDLETELYRKHTLNYERIGAYDGVSDKCPACKRALDETGTVEIAGLAGIMVCCKGCGERLGAELVPNTVEL
jgi:hypothetical protein